MRSLSLSTARKKLGFPFLLLCISLWGGVSAIAQELYSSRPKILAVKPVVHPELGSDWKALKRAHLEATAMLIEMYPDHEIYFLARDSELLYDSAILATRDEPELAKHIHLLNISTASVGSEHLKEYLGQEGISEQTLRAGKKILFVDTGFNGTIPAKIGEIFPENLRNQMQTHLMISGNVNHPSTRVFMAAVNPEAASMTPAEMQNLIVNYEHLPRYTSRATGFSKVDGKWIPSGAAGVDDDGKLSAKVGEHYMEDLSADLSTKKQIQLLAEKRKFWSEINQLAKSGNSDALRTRLLSILKAHPKDHFIKASVRDVLDMANTTLSSHHLQISSAELGLPEIKSHSAPTKNDIIQKFPEWKPILENPQTEIPKLIKKKDFGKLDAISSAYKDPEIEQITFEALGKELPTPEAKGWVRSIIEKGNQDSLQAFGASVLSKKAWNQDEALVQSFLQASDSQSKSVFLMKAAIFDSTHPSLLHRLLQSTDPELMNALSQAIASEVLAHGWSPELISAAKHALQFGNRETFVTFAMRNIVTVPRDNEVKLLLETVLEKAPEDSFQVLARRILDRTHHRFESQKMNIDDVLATIVKRSKGNPVDEQTIEFVKDYIGDDFDLYPRAIQTLNAKVLKHTGGTPSARTPATECETAQGKLLQGMFP